MLRTLLVDDEAPARARMRRLLRPLAEAGRLTVAAEAADGEEALDVLAESPVDLLLLDVQMPGLSGFEVVERMGSVLGDAPRPAVVFVTAYDRYALAAFEAAAVDYLLKPVSADRLAEAVSRTERLVARPEPVSSERLSALLSALGQQVGRPAEPVEPPLERLSIPGPDRLTVVPVERLVAAEVEDGQTVLTFTGEAAGAPLLRHTVTTTLDALERRLDPHAFFRVHRSALVQVAHIRAMVPWFSGRLKLELTGGHALVASRTRSRELRERLSL